jgi:hypothetical protein
MRLNADDRIWCPVDRPDYLCVLERIQQPPRNLDHFLNLQRHLLQRLVAAANDGEIELANHKLEDNLSPEELLGLPCGLFHHPKAVRLLLENPADLSGLLHQWKKGFADVVNLPPMSPAEASQEAAGLSLESFLDRLL